jgi:hypothetical protein
VEKPFIWDKLDDTGIFDHVDVFVNLTRNETVEEVTCVWSH